MGKRPDLAKEEKLIREFLNSEGPISAKQRGKYIEEVRGYSADRVVGDRPSIKVLSTTYQVLLEGT